MITALYSITNKSVPEISFDSTLILATNQELDPIGIFRLKLLKESLACHSGSLRIETVFLSIPTSVRINIDRAQ